MFLPLLEESKSEWNPIQSGSAKGIFLWKDNELLMMQKSSQFTVTITVNNLEAISEFFSTVKLCMQNCVRTLTNPVTKFEHQFWFSRWKSSNNTHSPTEEFQGFLASSKKELKQRWIFYLIPAWREYIRVSVYSRNFVRGMVVFSETGEGYVVRSLKPIPKMAKICHFLYSVSDLTKTRYPNSHLTQVTNCFGLDKKIKSLKFQMFFFYITPGSPFAKDE